MNRRFVVVGIVALVAATVSTWFFYRLVSDSLTGPQAGEMATVVIATRDLPRGARIEPRDVEAAPWAAGEPPQGAVSDPAALVGRAVRLDVARGEPVLESRLAQAGENGVAALIPPGMRAVTVHVEEFAGVNQLLARGDRVDLHAANSPRRPGHPNITLKTLLENVEVLSDGREELPNGRPNNVPTVTVLVKAEDAEAVALADQAGSIRLALRNPLDNGSEYTRGVAAEDVFAQSPSPRPRRPARSQRPAPKRKPPAPAPPQQPGGDAEKLSRMETPQFHRLMPETAPEGAAGETEVLLGLQFAGLGDEALAELTPRLKRRHLAAPVIVSSFLPGWDAGEGLEKLRSHGRLQVFTEPRFLAPEGTAAVFSQSSELPLRGKHAAEGVQASLQRIELDRVGVRVALTPELLPDGRLRIRVRSETATPDPARTVEVAGAEFPRVSVRQAECDVDLVPGQSFWIRGLIDRPGAWDFLRALFPQRPLERNAQDELVVLVTARVLPAATQPELTAVIAP